MVKVVGIEFSAGGAGRLGVCSAFIGGEMIADDASCFIVVFVMHDPQRREELGDGDFRESRAGEIFVFDRSFNACRLEHLLVEGDLDDLWFAKEFFHGRGALRVGLKVGCCAVLRRFFGFWFFLFFFGGES